MENIEDFKKKYINLEKFLFIWKEPHLHKKAFLDKTTLKAGVLICSIINMLLSTSLLLHSIEEYTFLFFFGYFLPNILLMAGSILLLLSMEHMEEKKAYWGYMLTAGAAWVHAGLVTLSLIFGFVYSPKAFFRNLIGSILLITFVLAVNLYTAWVDYCFVKHLTAGHLDLVETGRGEGLISKEQGPGEVGPVVKEEKMPHADLSKNDFSIDIEKA